LDFLSGWYSAPLEKLPSEGLAGLHAMWASAALDLVAVGAPMLVPSPQQRRETAVKPHPVNR
jgi:hypothetical protein